MDDSQFVEYLSRMRAQIEDAVRHRAPVKIGREASDMFKENFRRSGYQGNGFTPWAITRRQQSGGKDADSQYGPLLSRQPHLMPSVQYIPGDASVVISNPLPYAQIHNDGGTIYPTVTPALRAHFWKEYYAHGGHVKGSTAPETPESKIYKAIALTKKPSLRVHIPKRQFMGDSPELRQRIKDNIESILNSILK